MERRAAKELLAMEEHSANAERSFMGRLQGIMNTIDPVPEPRRPKPRPPVPMRLRPVPKTEAELLAAAKNTRLFGPNQERVLQRPRGKLIGSIYQSWKAR